jgi:adenylate cyclase
VLCALLLAQFEDPLWRIRVRDMAFDQLQKMHPAAYVEDIPVRVIAIDDPSLAEIGQWPWPRTVLAQIIDRLTALGARVVVLDMLLAEADRTSPEQVKEFWPESAPLNSLLAQFPSHDRILAESFKRSRVVTGLVAQSSDSPAPPPSSRSEVRSAGGDARDWLPGWRSGVGFLRILESAAVGTGVVTVVADQDGILRSMPLIHHVNGTLYPSLAVDALRAYLDTPFLTVEVKPEGQDDLQSPAGIRGVKLGDSAFLPTTSDGRVWLHARPIHKARYVSAIDLLTGETDPQRIKDHIVIIGATSAGLGDVIRTPLGEAAPGLEGHLQLMEQVLTGDYLLRPAWENTLVAAIWVAAALLMGVALARLRPAWTVGLAVAAVAGLGWLSSHLFESHRLLLDPVFPAFGLLAIFLSLSVPRYLRTEKEQRWIKNAFSRYVSPNRVKFLQEHPETLALGGEYRECSFVMTDLAGFTAMMEKYEPAMLSALLNEYLNGMISIAFEHEGTLDRIVGDAVAVMFSAPVPQPDHAARAVACALAMDQFAHTFSLQQQAKGIPFGKTRIGVNTGHVMVGNFGGKVMLDYRALGDAINTAARLETLNNHLGTRISVSGSTVAKCPDFLGRPAGNLILKGKNIPTQVFEPLSAEDYRSERSNAYNTAYAWMDSGSPDALAAFRKLRDQYPEDALVSYHVQRLEAGDTGSLITLREK